MRVEGEIRVEAPRERVFSRVSDAPFFVSCIDGVKDLRTVDDTHYSALFETRVAYMRFEFKVSVQLTKAIAPKIIEAEVDGAPIGVVGRLTATASTQLSEDKGQTVIHYVIDAALTGKLGSIGEPVLKAKAKEMEKQFTRRLLAEFANGNAETHP